ncbi:excalibur calcium-binding domain-containing protein [Nocardia sp. Marseille-Q1738]
MQEQEAGHSTSSRPAAASTAPQHPVRDCAEAWAAGKAPVRRSDAGYSIQQDGTACAGRPPSPLIIVWAAYSIGSAARTRPPR